MNKKKLFLMPTLVLSVGFLMGCNNNNPKVDPTISSIGVNSSKAFYKVNEDKLKPEDLTVTAYYTDGSTNKVNYGGDAGYSVKDSAGTIYDLSNGGYTFTEENDNLTLTVCLGDADAFKANFVVCVKGDQPTPPTPSEKEVTEAEWYKAWHDLSDGNLSFKYEEKAVVAKAPSSEYVGKVFSDNIVNLENTTDENNNSTDHVVAKIYSVEAEIDETNESYLSKTVDLEKGVEYKQINADKYNKDVFYHSEKDDLRINSTYLQDTLNTIDVINHYDKFEFDETSQKYVGHNLIEYDPGDKPVVLDALCEVEYTNGKLVGGNVEAEYEIPGKGFTLGITISLSDVVYEDPEVEVPDYCEKLFDFIVPKGVEPNGGKNDISLLVDETVKPEFEYYSYDYDEGYINVTDEQKEEFGTRTINPKLELSGALSKNEESSSIISFNDDGSIKGVAEGSVFINASLFGSHLDESNTSLEVFVGNKPEKGKEFLGNFENVKYNYDSYEEKGTIIVTFDNIDDYISSYNFVNITDIVINGINYYRPYNCKVISEDYTISFDFGNAPESLGIINSISFNVIFYNEEYGICTEASIEKVNFKREEGGAIDSISNVVFNPGMSEQIYNVTLTLNEGVKLASENFDYALLIANGQDLGEVKITNYDDLNKTLTLCSETLIDDPDLHSISLTVGYHIDSANGKNFYYQTLSKDIVEEGNFITNFELVFNEPTNDEPRVVTGIKFTIAEGIEFDLINAYLRTNDNPNYSLDKGTYDSTTKTYTFDGKQKILEDNLYKLDFYADYMINKTETGRRYQVLRYTNYSDENVFDKICSYGLNGNVIIFNISNIEKFGKLESDITLLDSKLTIDDKEIGIMKGGFDKVDEHSYNLSIDTKEKETKSLFIKNYATIEITYTYVDSATKGNVYCHQILSYNPGK